VLEADALKPLPTDLIAIHLAGTVVVPSRLLEIVSTPVSGTVRSIGIDNMQRIAVGRTIATLDSPQGLEWQREYLQQRAIVLIAQSKLDREEQLFKDGIVSESRLSDARNGLVIVSLPMREKRNMLRLAGLSDNAIESLGASGKMALQTTIVASASGLVLEQMVSLGQRVDAGTPIVKIARDGPRWIEMNVPRDTLPQLRVGDTVTVAGCKANGKVIALAGQVQASSQAVLARAEFLNGSDCLRPNQHVDIGVTASQKLGRSFVVPASSIVHNKGKDYVFVRRERGFMPVLLESVQEANGRAIVCGPLTPAMEVVDKGIASLKGAWLGIGEVAASDAVPINSGTK
jgi:multidrug efflux pump subunit AcrA (membrane-fusion protein)